jgi:hypothetical protein
VVLKAEARVKVVEQRMERLLAKTEARLQQTLEEALTKALNALLAQQRVGEGPLLPTNVQPQPVESAAAIVTDPKTNALPSPDSTVVGPSPSPSPTSPPSAQREVDPLPSSDGSVAVIDVQAEPSPRCPSTSLPYPSFILVPDVEVADVAENGAKDSAVDTVPRSDGWEELCLRLRVSLEGDKKRLFYTAARWTRLFLRQPENRALLSGCTVDQLLAVS